MCGINGVHAYHYASNPVNHEEVTLTRDYMAARGPDGAGTWFSENGRVGLGHRRLAIVDLSEAGAQPMTCADGRLVVSFNGEIYNYPELRRGLEMKGRVFRSHSDTEVLLHLFAEKGIEMVRDLRGMFAFAIWDSRSCELFLARDAFGIKPLYYADDGWTFRFASQVKALLSGGQVSRDPDPAGRTGFFLFGSVPEPFTSWRAIRALPAGTTLLVNNTGAGEPVRYHKIASVYHDAAPAPHGLDAVAEVRAALTDSVRAHLMADVPVGAFLSAGIDSGALVGLMRDAGANDIQTVTLAFEDFTGTHNDESALAREVAQQYGVSHTTRVVTRAEFEADLPVIFDAMDQPSIDGINTWFVSKGARELGLKVVISGLGGDELLGGYSNFRDLPRWVRRLSMLGRVPLLGRAVRTIGSRVAAPFGVNPKAAGMLELGGTWRGAWLLKRGLFLPWELGEMLDSETVRLGLRRLNPLGGVIGAELEPSPGSTFGRVASLESSLYMRNQLLRDSDWASMAHSLELRVPLVDSSLLARLAPFRGNFGAQSGKLLLANAPSRPLPVSVAHRAKTGFTTPVEMWMRESSLVRDITPLLAAKARATAPWARDWSRVVAARALTMGSA